MTARAVINQQTSRRLPSTHQAKIVDDATHSKASGDLRRINVGGVSVPSDAPQQIKDSLVRRGRLAKESEERKQKRRRPPKNPWDWERKEKARLWREYRLREAYQAYWDKLITGIEPTDKQKNLVGRDVKKTEREWRNQTAEAVIPGQEPWTLAKSYAVSRAKNGYQGKAGMLAGGNQRYAIRHDFTETWLRSTLSYVLQRFVMATPKAGRRRLLKDGTAMQPLMGGPTKSDRKEYWGKIEALDQDYITLLSVLRAGWRIEIDRDFASWEQLRGYLARKVRRGRLACMPHVVVAAEDENGKVLHPHLWWLLPEDNEVWNDLSDKRCRKEPIELYNAVVNGTFYELQDIGADAGGLSSPMDGKNPLCPKWSVKIWNEDIFPTLREWASCVQIWHRREHLVREQAISSSGLPAHRSNGVFSDARQLASDILRNAHCSGNKSYLELLCDRRELAAWLLDGLVPAFAQFPDQNEVREVLRRVARYVAGEWDPHAMEPNKRRGIGYDYVRRIECRDADGEVIDAGVLERQAVGGQVAAAIKQAASIDAIVTAMETLAEAGRALTLKNATSLVDRHPKTVQRNWVAAWTAYHDGRCPDFRCLLGGDQLMPGQQEEHSASSEAEPTLPTPAVDIWPGGYTYPDLSSDSQPVSSVTTVARSALRATVVTLPEMPAEQETLLSTTSTVVGQPEQTPVSRMPVKQNIWLLFRHLGVGQRSAAASQSSVMTSATSLSFVIPSVRPSAVASCSPSSTETPEHGPENRSSCDNECPSWPPSPDGALSRRLSIDQAGDGPGLECRIPQEPCEARSPGSSTRRGRPAGVDRGADVLESGLRKTYATVGRRDPAIGDDAVGEADLPQRGDQTSTQVRHEQHDAGENLTSAGAQLILFVPNMPWEAHSNRPPAADDCESRPPAWPSWLKRRA